MAKFKPRARLIRTIGDKLISGPEAAIIELVKNAYDADSPKVVIKITPSTYINDMGEIFNAGRVVISDSGHGMTYDEIIGVWLEPATDIKEKNNLSRSGKRKVLGAKGVGRFASSILGKNIIVTSIAYNNGVLEKSQLKLDWEVFERVEYLDDIEIDVRKIPLSANDSATGLTLEIYGIKVVWSEKFLDSIVQELRRLASLPAHSSIENINPFDIHLDLSDFQMSIERREYLDALANAKNKNDVKEKKFLPFDFDGAEFFSKSNVTLEDLAGSTPGECAVDEYLIKPYSLGDNSDYLLKGKFDSDGGFNGHFTILRGDGRKQEVTIPAPLIDPVNEQSCGEFNIELKIFDLEADSIKRMFGVMGLNYELFSLPEARKFITENTGISIYRNSFRVRPYGNYDHDWLNLEKRRVQNPSHRIGHGQIAGSIYILDEIESNLVERSSREGLEKNGSFERLKNLVINLLLNIEAARFEFRKNSGISRPPKKDFAEAREAASLEKIRKTIAAIEHLESDDREKLQVQVNKESKALAKIFDGLEAYQKLLESRAVLGDVVAEVLHEGRGYLIPINDAKGFFEEYKNILTQQTAEGDVVRGELPKMVHRLKDGTDGISSLFNDINPISGRKRGKATEFSILDVVERVERLTTSVRRDSQVFIEHNIEKFHKCFGHSGDLQAALMNLVNNATYWLELNTDEPRVINIIISVGHENYILDISNNGPRINEMHEDLLFSAGFTLKTSGHGLGLVIAREACRNSGGDLTYNPIDGKTTFRIEFPKV